MKKQILNIAFAGMAGVLFLFGANAAPTVRKLGAAAVPHTAATASATKSTSSNAAAPIGTPSRISTTRLAPTASVKTTTSTLKASDKAAAAPTDSNAARLSIGKYLHGTNIVKTTTAVNNANMAAEDIVILKDKVAGMEQDIETTRQDLDSHIADSVVHVTSADKDAWNDKQDKLIAGDGIVLGDDGKISTVMNIPSGSEDGDRTVPIWVE